MGTKCAPPYSGIFMHYLESNLKKGFESCILLWLRYIDDMFILFRGSLKKLNAFIEHANTFHNSIKFTFEYSKTTVNFLDVQVTKDKYHKLQTSIYRKPTKKNLLLKFSSFHPFHIFRNLVYNQSLRLCTIISTRYQLSTELNNLKQIFLARGYPERLIDTQIKKALLINRKHLLKSRPKKQPSECYSSKSNIQLLTNTAVLT